MTSDLKEMDPDSVPFGVPGESSSGTTEQFAFDVDGVRGDIQRMEEDRIARERRREKIKFLSPKDLPVGDNVLKVLGPWSNVAPHAGRFWRAVWVHHGLGPDGERKTAVCARRMNKAGLPWRAGEERLGDCPVCKVLDGIFAIPFDERTPEEKKHLSDFRARLTYIFNVVWLRGGGKSHVDDGAQVFTCSPEIGENLVNQFDFALRMARGAELPGHFDVQFKKLPAEGKVFNGRQVYDFEKYFPSMPIVEIDLADAKFKRHDLGALYKAKAAAEVELLFRQTPLGAAVLGALPAGAAAALPEPRMTAELPGPVPAPVPAPVAPAAPVSTSAPAPAPPPPRDEDEPPFQHRPVAARPAAATAVTPAPAPRHAQADEEENQLAAMAARGRGRRNDRLAADLMRAAKR